VSGDTCRPVSTALFVGADAHWSTHDAQKRINHPGEPERTFSPASTLFSSVGCLTIETPMTGS
jgi:hypothetical protein